MKLQILLALLTLLTATNAWAAPSRLLERAGSWNVMTYKSKHGKVCYFYARPQTRSPAGLDHGDVSFFVSSSPKQGVLGEANFVAGYEFREGSVVGVDVDGENFTMFTKNDSAWLSGREQDRKLLHAMKKGRTMTVRAISARGNPTRYTFALSGVTKAAGDSRKACR
ncbi:hypothetical protein SAMN05216548_10572 [Faunimonas pinastri]|uniref:Uncharacterized protein n=1 Tax=Faunimonas pinastri TaxID=1855383 RepID=A0A1H9GL84_9HYPH|nr:invasion associated locus B family protein [Faunimonas pinastri]SEQ50688.1 hypothetical protein SAMN05216548_10572 [Faunimonas pinastri]